MAVRNAHQFHGAIGTTAEHELHTLALPVLAWREEFGTLHGWDDQVTTAAMTSGPACGPPSPGTDGATPAARTSSAGCAERVVVGGACGGGGFVPLALPTAQQPQALRVR